MMIYQYIPGRLDPLLSGWSGFQALSDDVELMYCHSAAYCAQDEAGLNPQDPRLALAWPLVITELSARDAGHPLLRAGSLVGGC